DVVVPLSRNLADSFVNRISTATYTLMANSRQAIAITGNDGPWSAQLAGSKIADLPTQPVHRTELGQSRNARYAVEQACGMPRIGQHHVGRTGQGLAAFVADYPLPRRVLIQTASRLIPTVYPGQAEQSMQQSFGLHSLTIRK